MASANVELVRSIFAAWERGDFGSTGWADADIEFVRVDGPAPGSWRGSEIAGAIREMLRAWEEFRLIADGYHELDDDRVLVLVSFTARGKGSGIAGRQLRATGAELFQLGNGKVTRLVTYYDRERTLRDVDLAPQSGSR